jgi:hypothetical protein
MLINFNLQKHFFEAESSPASQEIIRLYETRMNYCVQKYRYWILFSGKWIQFTPQDLFN